MNVEWLMFLGPLRISIFFFMIFLLYRIVSLKSSNQKGLNFLIPRYCLFLSLAVLVGFLLTLLNAYDLLMILLILFSTIFMIFMNFKKKNTLGKQLRKIYSRLILYTVIKVEKGETFIDSHNVNKQRTNDGYSRLSGLNRKWQFALAAVILGLIYSSRFFYAAYDNHTLSESWYNEIGLIKEISAQHWFFYTGSMMGDNLLINIYGKLAHVSDAIALQSSGLIEVSVLALVLYWVAFKITGNHGPGCIAALSFGFLYAFLPVNLNQLLQHKSIFLALTLAIPTMAFTIFPKALRLDQRVYLRWMFYFFCAIFLINLFVGLYIVPSFLVLAVIFNYKYRRVYVLRSLLAYSIALVTIGIIYSIASLIMKENLWDFFISNIFSFSSYTYARPDPHNIFPEGDISILTSISEGFPYTVLESMSCGVPVVATDVGGVNEALGEGCGYACKPKDAEEIGQRVIDILYNDDLRKNMGLNARGRVLENFTIDKFIAQYEEVYDTVVNHCAPVKHQLENQIT